MAGYQPLYVKAYETGLVQNRQNFILPDDAYPTLENAYVWRERIKRKQGYSLLGRLKRNLSIAGVTGIGSTSITFNLFTIFGISLITEPYASIVLGSVFYSVALPDLPATFSDNGLGGFNVTGNALAAGSTINYVTGDVTLKFVLPTLGGGGTLLNIGYYPGLPVMGLRTRELNAINNEQLVAFDTKYAYIFSGGWQEFITGTTWTGTDSNFFWSTNYWTTAAPNNLKLFWVTNFSGTTGDPIRYTDGTTWTNFAPSIQNGSTDKLTQCLCLLPFRGRLVAFNTLEGFDLATSAAYTNRIRWAAIGSPLTAGAWHDDVRGKGGFLDIPTSEDIISVGFVRDNLVIYCERSTWQLRYTGRTIAPFQIEKVNSELGAESTFSAVQFDTSLVGIGDKGVVECDSFKSQRIDIKIPDLVFQFNNDNNDTRRVHGIRDFVNRLAYWTYCDKENPNGVYPDKRLVYNYENDSWAIFIDSLTTLGTFQPQTSRRWSDYSALIPANIWSAQNYPWSDRPSGIPDIVGGNQQGYVEILDQNTTNDVSLTINDITGNDPDPTVITSYAHNLQNGQIIQISGIPTGTPFDNLNEGNANDGIYEIERIDNDTFTIWVYDPITEEFNTTQADAAATYIGGGQIAVRDNFRVVSKKFNKLDEGRQFQLGFIDVLFDETEEGQVTLKVYTDYNDNSPTNIPPLNSSEDTFFNSVVPTGPSGIGIQGGSKNWKRVICPTVSNFITIEWTLSNLQMTTQAQESNVQIDAQIIWNRTGGRMGICQ